MGVIRSIVSISNSINKAKKIKNDPEKQPKSKRFGILSIICSLFAVALSSLVYLFPMWLSSNNIVLIVVGVVVGIGIGAIGAVTLLFHSIINLWLQFYINKKAISWVSLAILILAIIAIVVILIFILK